MFDFNQLLAVVSYNTDQVLNYQFLGNLTKDYLIVLGVFLATLIIIKIFKVVLISRIKKLADHTKTDFDDLLIKIVKSVGWLFYLSLALYLAFQFIVLPEIVERIVLYAFFVAIAYYAVKAAQRMIDYGVNKMISRMEEKGDNGFDPSAVRLITNVIKGVLWALAIIIILQNFGYNVTSLVVGLGVGGIAIAFALQNILEDMFSSFSIYLDKPFKTGDFIIIGTDMGVVKHIGIKSTRIQTLQGEELVVSNRELTSARVQNFKKLEKRRVVFKFGVTYNTKTEKLRKIPEIVKEIIGRFKIAELDRVHFKEFGDFSLNFEVVYYINSKEYIDYMNTQQEINLAVKERFEKEKIEMAFPTQTIYVNK